MCSSTAVTFSKLEFSRSKKHIGRFVSTHSEKERKVHKNLNQVLSTHFKTKRAFILQLFSFLFKVTMKRQDKNRSKLNVNSVNNQESENIYEFYIIWVLGRFSEFSRVQISCMWPQDCKPHLMFYSFHHFLSHCSCRFVFATARDVAELGRCIGRKKGESIRLFTLRFASSYNTKSKSPTCHIISV